METRAKMMCSKVERTEDGQTENVWFNSEYNNTDVPEDNTFSKFTPTANCYLCITNSILHGTFKEGEYYYFDIKPVDTTQNFV